MLSFLLNTTVLSCLSVFKAADSFLLSSLFFPHDSSSLSAIPVLPMTEALN